MFWFYLLQEINYTSIWVFKYILCFGSTLEGKLLFPSHILLRWDISSDILKELKLLLNINETRLGLSGTENTWPTNINMKFDLYSLSKPFDELEVTWNSAPKAELLAKDFVSVLSNRSSGVEIGRASCRERV